jgi:predicted nuclease of restriction endonuclease-like RecB superfamily
MLKNLYGWNEEKSSEEYEIASALYGDREVNSIWNEAVAIIPEIITIIEKNNLQSNAYVSFNGYSLSISLHSEPNQSISEEIRTAYHQIDELFSK